MPQDNILPEKLEAKIKGKSCAKLGCEPVEIPTWPGKLRANTWEKEKSWATIRLRQFLLVKLRANTCEKKNAPHR
jgi:hypothetical protein